MIGLEFLNSYYTILDYENKRVGFILANQSAADVNKEGIIILILLIIVAVFTVTCCCCCCCCCRPCRKWRNVQHDMADYVENEEQYKQLPE